MSGVHCSDREPGARRWLVALAVLGAWVGAASCDTPLPEPRGDDSGTTETGDTSDTTETGDTTDTSDTADTSDTSDTSDTADTGDTGMPPGWYLTCAPLSTHLNVGTGPQQTLQFTAEWQTPGGPSPATGVAWDLFDGPGSVSGNGLYTTAVDAGGLAQVRAWASNQVAICEVEVEIDAAVNQSGSGGVPGAFGGTTPTISDACAAVLLYPLDDSAMPGSFAPPLIQWTAAGANMHELELSSDWTTVRIYTSQSSYQPSQAQWWGLTRYDPGSHVEMSLTSGTWNGSGFSSGTCTATTRTTVEVTDANIGGTIVYWAPPLTKAISFDAVTGQLSNDPVALPSAICHGCHTVNLAQPMRMTYGPDIPGKTNLVHLASPSSILKTWGNGFTEMKDYAAQDHTGDYVAISGLSLTGGSTLKVFDQNSGALVSSVNTSRAPTMPNWSPDGTKLVYAGCDSGATALGGTACNLYVQTWNPTSKSFSNETLLAQAPSNHTLYYPTFSPDSQWVAYNRAEMWTDTTSGELQTTNANPRARVMLVSASGGTQLELTDANGVGFLTNSWPRWAPATGTYAWLAYSTQRAYGTQVSGRAQLWVTAIDLSTAASGSEPSRPPTWIPGQLLGESNHTPTWLPYFKP